MVRPILGRLKSIMCDGIFILEKAEEEEYDGNKNKYICSR